ncbi:hypothetical protein F4805DRAFT_460082 [Annulohypoxylon moriforme]|nr:hypothetical protein F4805DRAFT_460082 [Annulohypoxylon moriforme]
MDPHMPDMQTPSDTVQDGYPDEKSSIIIYQGPPKPRPRKLIVGGPGYNEKYTKGTLKRIATEAKDTKTRPARRFHLESTDITANVSFRARCHEDAIRYAVRAPTINEAGNSPCLVMYVDGSARDGYSGFGISYKRFNMNLGRPMPDCWTDASYVVRGTRSSGVAEILAIHRSLLIAQYAMMDFIQRSPGRWKDNTPRPKVIILSDGLSALNYIKGSYHYKILSPGTHPRKRSDFGVMPDSFFDEAYKPIDVLVSLGVNVEFHWVPGHIGIEGNVRADRLANLAAGYMSRVLMDSGSELALIPVQYYRPEKKLKILEIHNGNPFTDLIYWQKEETKEIMDVMLEVEESRFTRDFKLQALRLISGEPSAESSEETTRKRKASDIELEEDENSTHPEPPTKKLKVSIPDPIEGEAGTSSKKGTNIKGLICWKD